jgi:hypothetical protein
VFTQSTILTNLFPFSLPSLSYDWYSNWSHSEPNNLPNLKFKKFQMKMIQMVEMMMMQMSHHHLLLIPLLLLLLPHIHLALHLSHHPESAKKLHMLLQHLQVIGPSVTSDNPEPGGFFHLQLSNRILNLLLLSKVKGMLIIMLKLICKKMVCLLLSLLVLHFKMSLSL